MRAVTYTYDAWGNITSIKNASGNEITNPASMAFRNSVRYRGYVYDSETGLYYLQSRYYDPETGRFISSDQPEYIGANDDVLGWNSFSYCENEPVDYVDYYGYEKNNINVFSSELALIFTTYSIRRNRSGNKYNVILGDTSPLYINKWVSKYSLERIYFYKLLGIKYTKSTQIIRVTKTQYKIKKFIMENTIGLLSSYAFDKFKINWLIGHILGKGLSSFVDRFSNLIKTPGKYRTISIVAKIYVKTLCQYEYLVTIYNEKFVNNKWALYGSVTTGVMY